MFLMSDQARPSHEQPWGIGLFAEGGVEKGVLIKIGNVVQ